ncbi:TPA: hypothetical protein ACFP4Y_001051 [Neisseria bacilliformis]|nr:hypothetical protein [Neisseria bacilliformis]
MASPKLRFQTASRFPAAQAAATRKPRAWLHHTPYLCKQAV